MPVGPRFTRIAERNRSSSGKRGPVRGRGGGEPATGFSRRLRISARRVSYSREVGGTRTTPCCGRSSHRNSINGIRAFPEERRHRPLAWQFPQDLREGVVGGAAEEHEHRLLDFAFRLLQMRRHCAERNRGGFFQRVAIDARADGRKTDGRDVALSGKLQALSVTGCQQFRLAVMAVPVDRAYSVKYVLRGQLAGSGCDRASGRTTADAGADRVQL